MLQRIDREQGRRNDAERQEKARIGFHQWWKAAPRRHRSCRLWARRSCADAEQSWLRPKSPFFEVFGSSFQKMKGRAHDREFDRAH